MPKLSFYELVIGKCNMPLKQIIKNQGYFQEFCPEVYTYILYMNGNSLIRTVEILLNFLLM